MLHAAWGLLLARCADASEVLFGSASNGRPSELAGVDQIVGPFINNLPVRLTLRPAQSATDFIRETQEKLLTLTSHQHSSMTEMQEWSEIPWHRRLFDSLVVFQNFTPQEKLAQFGNGVELADFVGPVHTNYPLTLMITPGPSYEILLAHQTASCSVTRARMLLEEWKQLVLQLTAAESTSIATVLASCQIPAGISPNYLPVARTAERVPPRTAMEQAIAGIWQRALGVADISVQENFFDLGGQSLLMLRVHQKLRSELNLNISIVQTFAHPTIAALAASLGENESSFSMKPAALQPSVAGQLATQARARASAARAAMARNRGQGLPPQ